MSNYKLILFSILTVTACLFPKVIKAAEYYVATNGNDNNPGTQNQPWKTILKAISTVTAGQTIYVRGGDYTGIATGHKWNFSNSGTESQPIKFTNYPGEQVVLHFLTADRNDRQIFNCSSYIKDHPDWQTPKADYIHIIGTDVSPHILSNGVESHKGIVMQGFVGGSPLIGEQSAGIIVSDCDYWEVAGVDFVETSSGIFTLKTNYGTTDVHSTDGWYVHDNRVYNYYRESGMQFNGNYNRIENNEIYKVSNRLDTPFGCQMLNLLGNNNVVKGNTLSRLGSTATCLGLLFEWDLSDVNLIENNLIYDVLSGINFQGGDNNLIRNNVIYMGGIPEQYRAGIEINSYDDTHPPSGSSGWPCNEESGYGSVLVPANNPSHPDFQYYYAPRNCLSYGNKIYNNTIHGFYEGIRMYPILADNTVIQNNAISGWTRGGICFYKSSDGTCKTLTNEVTADHNNLSGTFGFANLSNYDFHLTVGSSLIDQGTDLSSSVPDDFDGISRPQGLGFDIGAYEYTIADVSPTPTPPLAGGSADINGDGQINSADLILVLQNWLGIGSCNTFTCDLNSDSKINALDAARVIVNFGK